MTRVNSTCRLLIAGALAIALTACTQTPGAGGTSAGGGTSGTRRIAVIPKGTTNEYWKSVHAGAVKAARDAGVEVIWKGPVREDDRDEQIKVVENFLSQGVDGIVLAPLDDRALIPVLNDAKARKIPVLILDSGVQWPNYVSFVATDNEKAGGLAAERMGQQLGGKGDVIVLRYQEGSASTMARESGFLTALAQKYPGIRVVSSNQYGGVTTESAYAASENLLSTFKTVDGIFCPTESTTFGMLLALEAAGRTAKVKLVGFDASAKMVEALSQGKIDGLVVQDPFRMADLGVATLLKHLKGEPVERRIDTGEHLITRDNMAQPEMKALLSPDLARYLD
jgi:ribose transport system substrate-binding protein